ncbi:natterin-2-like [Ixodes scapularis]|uniref:natterin-2-like n=1 Tax=Ixodes scapularis TaxID=6945 RepID=UPI001C382536|nr:natterin-2-like [Ixodes scapularis]
MAEPLPPDDEEIASVSGSIADDNQEPSQFVFNLEEAVKTYANNLAALFNTKVSFYDMWRTQSVLRERGVYRRYKLSVRASNFQFGEPTGEQKRPTQVYTATYTNQQEKADVTHTVSQTYQNTVSTTSKFVRGFKLNYKTGGSVGIPAVLSAGGEFSFDYMFSGTTTKTETKTETLKIDEKVAVPPKSTVQVTWYVTNTQMDFPWTATITVRGWFAVWFEKAIQGHFLWFFPVSQLARTDSSLTAIDRQAVTFEASGVFTKVDTHDSRVFVHQLKSPKPAKPATTRRPKEFRTPIPLQ